MYWFSFFTNSRFIKKTTFTTLLFFLICPSAFTQSILGKWKTIDDETNRAKSIVEIVEKDGKVFGKILQIFPLPEDDPNPICDQCDDDDDRYNQKVVGMEVIRDLKKNGDEWEDGTILDPENGKVYDCKLWVSKEDPNKLNVRGYIAFFFRTQTWLRYE